MAPESKGGVTVRSAHTVFPERDVGNYLMSYLEMRRVKDAVRAIRDKMDWYKNLGFGLLTLAPAFGLAWLTWGPVYDQLSAVGQAHYAAVGSILGLGAIVCVLVAVLCFAFHGNLGKTREIDKDHVIALLEIVEERHVVSAETK